MHIFVRKTSKEVAKRVTNGRGGSQKRIAEGRRCEQRRLPTDWLGAGEDCRRGWLGVRDLGVVGGRR